MPRKARNIHAVLIVLTAVFLCCAAASASGGEDFAVRRIGNIHPYADNIFRVSTSEAGCLEIRIHDNLCVYRTINEEIDAGETEIHWDGCGYNREKLYEKTYTVTAELTTATGKIRSISFDSPVEYPAQCLQYALPSDNILYLDSTDLWFIEYRTVTNGRIIIEIVSRNDRTESYTYSVSADGGKIARKTFTDISGKKQVPHSGEYILSVYEYSRPEEKYESALQIRESSPEPEPIVPTGEIMPERTMSELEIWEMMMKPSVVIDIDSFKHQDVYQEPDPDSKSLGTLHGQSQGVKVIRVEQEWAKIGAWNHEEAAYVEGWVPLSKLKTEAPRGEYGLLIDKQKQTMTVYQNGKVIDTLLVSTGRAEKNSLFQETAAGCFLTGYHRVNFSMNGKKYDYVIQYDGGNLLHQTPYDWGQHKKDFTLGRGYLGAKASHACIRIQPEPGKGGLNAFWLFTHLPYHTRVMILDDPWEHGSNTEKLKRGSRADVDLSALHLTEKTGGGSEQQIVITFGGCMIPGGTRAFNSRNNSFSAFVQQNGYGLSLKGLEEDFKEDNLTCINLCCIIQKEQNVFPEEKGTLFAPAGTEELFRDASVELALMTDEKLISSGEQYCDGTEEVLNRYTDVMRSGQYRTYMLKGNLFGFAGCTESEYLKDPEIIDRRIGELKEAGCVKTVMLICWAEGHETEHSIIQEAMAHRSVRAGADLVVGNCRGTVQGIDLIEGVPVIYSLGDLLNGSVSEKPKKQQGILVRAVFSLEEDDVSITVIPVMPYGNTETKQNEYRPVSGLSDIQAEPIIRSIWLDSTEAAMERFLFYVPGQS